MKPTIVTNQPLTMTSREIADLTGKQHAHVFRDIKKMLIELNADYKGYLHEWRHPQNGQSYDEFVLDRDLTDCLLTGYSAEARMNVIKQWRFLEKQVKPAQSSQLPDLTDFIASLESNKVKIENQISEANKAQYHRDQFIAITSNLDRVTSKSQIQQECDCILNYLSSRGGSIDATSLENNILRTRNHPFSIYVNRGEARETLRSVVNRLSDSGYLKLDGDTVIKVTH